MSINTIAIDLSQEITQAEYCRRTGDTLANLAPKLKKMSVRDIPELGIRLINISAPILILSGWKHHPCGTIPSLN